MKKRVYVAGAYSANTVISVLNNMRNGMRTSLEVLLAGYAPFCPWLDYHYQLLLRPGESLAILDYYDYSMSWLEAAHVLLVLPGWEASAGTYAEIAKAEEMGIPIYYSIEDLQKNEETER
jgi:hypothetical protein